MTDADWQGYLQANCELLSERKMRLFGVACCWRVRHHLREPCYQDAILLGEQIADGLISLNEVEIVTESLWAKIQHDWQEHDEKPPPHLYASTAAASVVVPSRHPARWMDVLKGVCQPVAVHLAGINEETVPAAPWQLVVDTVATADYLTAKAGSLASTAEVDELIGETQALKIALKASADGAAYARKEIVGYLREILGPIDHSPKIEPLWLAWSGNTIPRIARSIYDGRRRRSGTFDNRHLAILADALEEAGCTDADILDHCRKGGEHFRGCWLIDLILARH
jgi:hypothetical protein